ncbi:MAG: hypothetical protein DRP91_00240 [Candidatus Neomarinimicrobiota bacterium]|nr:MAG: hypothetical protein DRP88_05900 [Candidatus Neomarinimicrobiota bacterium]RKY50940.1 MAG: hypothetical protein DRP91_00240 [Candidatus Neomarinimicrobiota bacterium]RKY53849.1 MAG: hypothetical protein DRP92_02540 [Candidatus Neomarinimicrobiota bacterium]
MNIIVKTLIIAIISVLFLAIIPVKDLLGDEMIINTTEEKMDQAIYQAIQTIRTTEKNYSRITITIISNKGTQQIIIEGAEFAYLPQTNYN